MICIECNGRGRWPEAPKLTPSQTGVYDDFTEVKWNECGTCQGTGESQNVEDADAFDIKGDNEE